MRILLVFSYQLFILYLSVEDFEVSLFFSGIFI